MSFIKTLCCFLLVVLMASCKDEPKAAFNASDVKYGLQPEASGAMGKFLNDYLSLKDALVATDHHQAHKSAIEMQDQMAFLTDSTKVILVPALASISKDLSNIISHDDAGCEPQRVYFKNLSDSLYAFVKNSETTNLYLYRHYCPMALNGKGGWWFSASTKVENPYFGSKMLSCGELVDTLQ